MTLVLAVETKDGVVMAADRIATNLWAKGVNRSPKMFAVKKRGHPPVAFGYCGSFRVGQIVQCMFEDADFYPPQTKRHDLTELWLIRQFIPNLIKLVNESGEDKKNVNLIIAVNGFAFEIQSDYSVISSSAGFVAIGSGGEMARGIITYCLLKHLIDGKKPESELITKNLERLFHSVAMTNPTITHQFDYTFIESTRDYREGWK